MTKEEIIEALAQIIVDTAKGDRTDAAILAGAMASDLIDLVDEKTKP